MSYELREDDLRLVTLFIRIHSYYWHAFVRLPAATREACLARLVFD